MKLTVKNWDKFQHYRDRSPPWIKLHKSLLDDQHWHALPDASKALAVSIWLIASESKDGSFDGASTTLAFRLRTDSKKIDAAIKPLIEQGFLVCDSNVLAECGQLAVSEERRGERETETEANFGSSIDKPVRFSPKKFLTDKGVDPKLADEYMAVRKAKKLTNTETALVAIGSEIEKTPLTFPDAIKLCVERSWGGFKKSWLDNIDVLGGKPSVDPKVAEYQAQLRRSRDEGLPT